MSQPIAATISPGLLPSLPIEKRGQLPDVPGIYFATFRGQVLYIGMASKSLRRRWVGHHRRSDLSDIVGVQLAYFVTAPSADLRALEAGLISIYRPPLNNAPIYSRGKKIPRHKDPRVAIETISSPTYESLSDKETIRLSYEELVDICGGDHNMAIALEDDLWSERDVARFRYNCAVIKQSERVDTAKPVAVDFDWLHESTTRLSWEDIYVITDDIELAELMAGHCYSEVIAMADALN